MNQKVVEALTAQVNKEFYSAYLYLAMNQHFEGEGMPGMATGCINSF